MHINWPGLDYKHFASLLLLLPCACAIGEACGGVGRCAGACPAELRINTRDERLRRLPGSVAKDAVKQVARERMGFSIRMAEGWVRSTLQNQLRNLKSPTSHESFNSEHRLEIKFGEEFELVIPDSQKQIKNRRFEKKIDILNMFVIKSVRNVSASPRNI